MNTPTKLPRFLHYARDTLGIKDAPLFEATMAHKGFGPDILHLVPDTDLREIGFSIGDTIRLKNSASTWLQAERNGNNSRKRKACNPSSDNDDDKCRPNTI
jgi:hypothetical protein